MRRKKSEPASVGQAEGRKHYRAPVDAELLKFGDSKKVRQLLLSEDRKLDEDDLQAEIEISGLELSHNEDKALHVIQSRLAATDFKGNTSRDGRVAVSFTPADYLEDFYSRPLEEIGRHQRDEALEALKSLATTTRLIVYKSRVKPDLYGLIRRRVQIVELLDFVLTPAEELYEHQTDQSSRRVMAITAIPHPVLMDGVMSFFFLKPQDFYKEIEECYRRLYGKKGRIPDAVARFLNWLLTKNSPEISISKEVLAERLRMGYFIKHRRQSELRKRLLECLEIAKELGYLLDYEEDWTGRQLILRLNPARISRLASGQKSLLKGGEP